MSHKNNSNCQKTRTKSQFLDFLINFYSPHPNYENFSIHGWLRTHINHIILATLSPLRSISIGRRYSCHRIFLKAQNFKTPQEGIEKASWLSYFPSHSSHFLKITSHLINRKNLLQAHKENIFFSVYPQGINFYVYIYFVWGKLFPQPQLVPSGY